MKQGDGREIWIRGRESYPLLKRWHMNHLTSKGPILKAYVDPVLYEYMIPKLPRRLTGYTQGRAEANPITFRALLPTQDVVAQSHNRLYPRMVG
jgi:hypothetical protein